MEEDELHVYVITTKKNWLRRFAINLTWGFRLKPTFYSDHSGRNVIKVSNPKSSTDTKAKQTVVVTIDKDQKLFIGAAPVSIDSLASQLKIFLAKETDKPSVVINGDSVASLGTTIRVMQIIKQLGATPVIAVDPSR